jgi:hypothetical protein
MVASRPAPVVLHMWLAAVVLINCPPANARNTEEMYQQLVDARKSMPPAAVSTPDPPWMHSLHALLMLDKLQTIHNVSHPLRPIRNDAFTWAQVSALLTSTGHSWCSLTRDNWACIGKRYANILKKTPLYNPALRLDAFPRGTRIFAEGNSFLAEMLYTVICNSNGVVWNVDGTESNSILSVDLDHDVAMLLLDNDDHWTHHHNRTVDMLHEAMDQPDLVVLGDLNNYQCAQRDTCKSDAHLRKAAWRKSFPGAVIMAYDGRLVPAGCEANFNNCRNSNENHACFPGPINQVAETMVGDMLVSLRHKQGLV